VERGDRREDVVLGSKVGEKEIMGRREDFKWPVFSFFSWGQAPKPPSSLRSKKRTASTAVAPGGPAERHSPLVLFPSLFEQKNR
jgi:hypothetical protein